MPNLQHLFHRAAVINAIAERAREQYPRGGKLMELEIATEAHFQAIRIFGSDHEELESIIDDLAANALYEARNP